MIQGYPLRPELMESTYLVYCATRDPALLQVCIPVLLLIPLIILSDKDVHQLTWSACLVGDIQHTS